MKDFLFCLVIILLLFCCLMSISDFVKTYTPRQEVIEVMNKHQDFKRETPKITVSDRNNNVYKFDFFDEALKIEVGKKIQSLYYS